MKWQPTPVFLLGKSHGQRSIVHGVSKNWMQLSMHAHTKPSIFSGTLGQTVNMLTDNGLGLEVTLSGYLHVLQGNLSVHSSTDSEITGISWRRWEQVTRAGGGWMKLHRLTVHHPHS